MEDARRFGDYLLIRPLRWGSTAELVLARELGAGAAQGREVVLKLLAPHLSSDPVHAGRLMAEGRLGRSLRHPGLIETLEVGQVGEVPFVVLEYVDGCDFAAVLDSRIDPGSARVLVHEAFAAFPVPAALELGVELCAALGYLHQHDREGRPASIVHRDVAPDNVMITRAGRMKLIDLGLAAEIVGGIGPASSALTGTIAYAAPEQLAGSPLDCRADLFSVGVILYELLSGQRLFARGSDAATLVAVLDADIEPLRSLRADVPAALERAIGRALERDRERRVQSAGELGAELEALMPAERFDLAKLLPTTQA